MEKIWYVAHTRPRCEKKLVEFCQRENLDSVLPCYRSVRKYRGKTVSFSKPLFPNYVFLKLVHEQERTVVQNKNVVNLLTVTDQIEFDRQLKDILVAIENDLPIQLAPEITEGNRVRIKSGPLRGVEGTVEKRTNSVWVVLRLDFIAQAAAVQVDATDLELS